MPGVANQLVTTKTPGVLSDQLAVGNDAHLGRATAYGNGLARPLGWDAVAVAIDPHQAGTGDAQHLFDIAVEGGADGPQVRLFAGKALGNALAAFSGMLTLGQLPAARGQPVVQVSEAGEARQWREQPFAHIADLIFDLTLLPTRRR